MIVAESCGEALASILAILTSAAIIFYCGFMVGEQRLFWKKKEHLR